MKYAVIQRGYACFGIGNTRSEAITDAAKWLGETNNGTTVEDVEKRLADGNEQGNPDGCIMIIDSSDEEWSDYIDDNGNPKG